MVYTGMHGCCKQCLLVLVVLCRFPDEVWLTMRMCRSCRGHGGGNEAVVTRLKRQYAA
jgi:hypothetical protein